MLAEAASVFTLEFRRRAQLERIAHRIGHNRCSNDEISLVDRDERNLPHKVATVTRICYIEVTAMPLECIVPAEPLELYRLRTKRHNVLKAISLLALAQCVMWLFFV